MASETFDPRESGNPKKQPVGRYVNLAITMDITSSTTVIEEDISLNCLTKQLHFIVPNLDGSNTAELIFHDEDDIPLYASGEKAESTTYVLNVERALCGTTTIRIETSGAQTANRVFGVKIIYLI